MTLEQVVAGGGLERSEAQALAAFALGVPPLQIITGARQEVSAAESARITALFERRRAGEPVAYILGEREFFSMDFKVTPAVLIPRPESELLVEFALERCAGTETCSVLDLGTGSGCVAISIAKHRARAHVVAVDASAAALAVAHENAQRHAVTKLELLASDWFTALAGRRFDLIVANPPYIAAGDPHLGQGDLRYEPPSALAGGADGLACIRMIVAAAPQYLRRDGWLAFEHGYDQAARCRELLAQAGFKDVFSRADLAGIERVSGGRRPDDAALRVSAPRLDGACIGQ